MAEDLARAKNSIQISHSWQGLRHSSYYLWPSRVCHGGKLESGTGARNYIQTFLCGVGLSFSVELLSQTAALRCMNWMNEWITIIRSCSKWACWLEKTTAPSRAIDKCSSLLLWRRITVSQAGLEGHAASLASCDLVCSLAACHNPSWLQAHSLAEEVISILLHLFMMSDIDPQAQHFGSEIVGMTCFKCVCSFH